MRLAVRHDDQLRPTADVPLDEASVLVVGCGVSGAAAARFALARGARVTIADDRDAAALGARASDLADAGARLVDGGIPAGLADDASLLVLSPGVPPGIPVVRRARERGVPIWGEAELAARHCRGRVVAVTGSNGKSTVTSLIGEILGRAGLDARAGGNLGEPFCDLLEGDSPERVYALELSSFQIETLESLHADVALLLNLSPDHLDRYASFDDYAAAKQRLFELQRPGAAAIVNADDGSGARAAGSLRARRFEFSVEHGVPIGAWLERDRFVLRTDDEVAAAEIVMARDEFALPGPHNAANALAAALACRLVGCDVTAIADGLRRFRGLPHRMQLVRTVDGVAYYDDSKATNPDAAARALASFEPGRVRIILGGRDKGASWDELLGLAAERARGVLLVGEAADALARRLVGTADVERAGTVGRAVRLAHAAAAPGEIVLLAPGCASFDQYANFEARGRDFAAAVEALDGNDDA